MQRKQACDLRWNAPGPAAGSVDEDPVRFAFCQNGIVGRAQNLIAPDGGYFLERGDPGLHDQPVPFKRGSQVCDLMRTNNPRGADGKRCGGAAGSVRMRDRAILKPPQVFDIVGVAVGVDGRRRNRYVVSVDRGHGRFEAMLFGAALSFERVFHAGQHEVLRHRIPGHFRAEFPANGNQTLKILRASR